MNSIGVSILALLGAVVLLAPRGWALVGMMGGVLYLTEQQAVDVLGLNVTAIRMLEVIGIGRIMVRGELASFNGVDRAVLLLYGYTTLVFLMRSDVGRAEMLGSLVDATLCYFTFRGLITSVDDLKWFLRALVIMLAPYVALLSVEMLTRDNPFTRRV